MPYFSYSRSSLNFSATEITRFKTLGELVAEIYQTMWDYNHTRIHSALKMPPPIFAEKLAA